ncbi:hypothetical protein, partial [Rhizobium leguminosarum]
RSSEDMATEMLAEVRVQDPRMTRIPVAQPLYTATATYKDEGWSVCLAATLPVEPGRNLSPASS